MIKYCFDQEIYLDHDVLSSHFWRKVSNTPSQCHDMRFQSLESFVRWLFNFFCLKKKTLKMHISLQFSNDTQLWNGIGEWMKKYLGFFRTTTVFVPSPVTINGTTANWTGQRRSTAVHSSFGKFVIRRTGAGRLFVQRFQYLSWRNGQAKWERLETIRVLTVTVTHAHTPRNTLILILPVVGEWFWIHSCP